MDEAVNKETKFSYRPLIGTYILAIGHVWMSLLYMFPVLSKIRYKIVGRVQIVNYIDSHGPYVVLAFLITGILLFYACYNKGKLALQISHTIAGAVVAGYTFAVTFGAIASHPVGPFIVPSLSLIITLFHIAIANIYITPKKLESKRQ